MVNLIDGRRWLRFGALLAGLCVVTILSGCKKPAETEAEPEATPAPAASAASTPAKIAAATPVPTSAAAPQAPPKPELAPPGIYFLLTALSVETSDGIVGLKPGQMLKEIKPGLYQADANQVSLRPDQMTNDLTIARRVAVQDQKTQMAIRSRLAAAALVATPGPGQSGVSRPGAAPAQDDTKLAARKELMQQLDDNAKASQQVSAALSNASAHWGGNWDVAAKKSPLVSQLLQQFNALQQERTEINAKLSTF
jgi:hypothetical protein